MARLIDADALYAKLGKMAREPLYQYDGEDYYVGIADASLAVYEAPTVDAVPVVRCKDCAHWYEPEGVCLKIYSDGAVSPYAWQDRNPDDFCSYGERRTDVQVTD